MSDDSSTRKKRRVSSEYQTPESITVEILDPVTIMEDGKPLYTTYKIITEVRPATIAWYTMRRSSRCNEARVDGKTTRKFLSHQF